MNRPEGSEDPTDDELALRLADLDQAIRDQESLGERRGRLPIELAALPGCEALELMERVRRQEQKAGSTDSIQRNGSPTVVGLEHQNQLAAGPNPQDEKAVTDGLPNEIGRFQIKRRIGSGGFGLVFLAFDPRMDRDVALKIPKLEAAVSDHSRRRFLRESRIAASLSHPNITAVFETGSVGSIHYMTSAHCGGGSLAEYLAKRRQDLSTSNHSWTWDAYAAATLVSALADAVDHAHQRKILHRDLKPSNILFDVGNPGQLDDQSLCRAARIVDFGLAKTLGGVSDTTRDGVMLGTLGYMSPEQAAGDRDRIGPGADIYSLGAILYELLTGEAPLRKVSDVETILAVQQEDPAPPRRIAPQCPRDLQAICLKCLRKSPHDRYASADELQRDLQRFLGGDPVQARPISQQERLVRWGVQNPLVATLCAAVATLAICSTVAAVALAKSRRDVMASLQAAEAARHEATRQAFHANVAHARSARHARLPGQRLDSLNAIAAATSVGNRNRLDPPMRRHLRNEAIAALSLMDIEQVDSWSGHLSGDVYPATDHDVQQYVAVEGQEILIRDVTTDKVLHRLKLDEPAKRIIGFAFSRDGRYFGTRFERSLADERGHVWDLHERRSLGAFDVGGFGNASEFLPDSQSLVSAGRDHHVEIRQLPTLRKVDKVEFSGRVATLAVHPSRPLIAGFIGPDRVEIRDRATGDLIDTLTVDSYVYAIAWSPNGRWFALAGRDGSLRVHPVHLDGRSIGQNPVWRRKGHASMVIHLAWHGDSEMLVTSSMDGVSRVWDADTGMQRIAVDELATCFSRDGVYLGTHGGRWRLSGRREHRMLRQPERQVHPLLNAGLAKRGGVTSEINFWEAFPGGRVVIGMNYYGLLIYDVGQDQILADVPLDGGGLRFSPDGKSAVFGSLGNGIQVLPVTVDERGDHIDLRIGPPRTGIAAMPGMFAVSERNTVVHQSFLGPTTVYRDRPDEGQQRVLTPPHAMAFFIDVHPKRPLLVTGTFKGTGIEVRDVKDGGRATRIEVESACPHFRPDGQQLAVAEIGGYSFWDTADWSCLHRIPAITRGVFPGSLAFSSDSQLVAIEDGSAIKLISTASFEPIAEFRLPAGEIIEALRFTPDMRYLLVGGGDEGITNVWDVETIRRRLRSLGLDWKHQPAVPMDQMDNAKPIKLDLRLE